ncbi:kif7 [Symbiodinium sp. CCMP2592]|nr:kif7 [Symbiodinium sp. CCMP2592]
MADAQQEQAPSPAWPSPHNAQSYSLGGASASTRDTLLASEDAVDPDDDLAGCIEQAVAAYLQNPGDAIPEELLQEGLAEEEATTWTSAFDEDVSLQHLQLQQEILQHQMRQNQLQAMQVLGYPSALAQAQLAAVPRDARILPQQAMFFNAPGATPAQAMKAGLLTTPLEQGAEWRPSPPPGIPSPTQVASEGAHDIYSPTKPGEEVTLPEEAQKVSARRSRRGGKLEAAGDSSRYWCSFHLLQAYAQFSVVPAMIGKRGVNTRTIFDQTGAKIRVRGRGSGHMESQTGKEAPAGLMVTVSSHRSDWNGFVEAVNLTGELIDRVQNQMYEKMGRSLGELCFEVALHDGGVYRLKEGKLVTEDCQLEFMLCTCSMLWQTPQSLEGLKC